MMNFRCPLIINTVFVLLVQSGDAAGHTAGQCEDVVEVVMAQTGAVGPVIGEITARFPEASNIGMPDCKDGMDGDVNFPFGDLKTIATVGECSFGFCMRGVPDGMGAYLLDDNTVRLVGQSESYGMISRFESMDYDVNGGTSTWSGSYIHYVDYDRSMMADFMSPSMTHPASEMVRGAGNMVEKIYNLKGQMMGRRNRNGGPTTTGAHYGSTDKDGNYVASAEPSTADWIMMSLCSADLAMKHQWGPGIGAEDTLFMTNEEWTSYNSDHVVGISAFALNAATKELWAVGVFGTGGFEKIVEINTGTTQYVAWSVSGYNGAFGRPDLHLVRQQSHGLRDDGNEYIHPQDVVPARVYIGKKDVDAHGNPSTSFLARNGLEYGKVYGFAIPSDGYTARDDWHKVNYNGATMDGGFYPTSWQWDGEVRNFENDISWEFQQTPVNGPDMEFWNAKGKVDRGAKTEHNAADPHGMPAFWQGSTAGYIGKYVLDNLKEMLDGLSGNDLPDYINATYHLLQGETPINDLINLGGKGQTRSTPGDQTVNCDGGPDSCKNTFEDVDGLGAIAVGDETYLLIQEDSGNDYGDRMFLTHATFNRGSSTSTKPFLFVAQSGGVRNPRYTNPCRVGIPAGSWIRAESHEFSGVVDISGFFTKNSNNQFIVSASDAGWVKRDQDKLVGINDKSIIVNVQAHGTSAGDVAIIEGDRGGQWLLYHPQNVPTPST